MARSFRVDEEERGSSTSMGEERGWERTSLIQAVIIGRSTFWHEKSYHQKVNLGGNLAFGMVSLREAMKEGVPKLSP